MASAGNKHKQSSLRESCNDILIIVTEFAVHNIFQSYLFIVFTLLIYLVIYNFNNGNNKLKVSFFSPRNCAWLQRSKCILKALK